MQRFKSSITISNAAGTGLTQNVQSSLSIRMTKWIPHQTLWLRDAATIKSATVGHDSWVLVTHGRCTACAQTGKVEGNKTPVHELAGNNDYE